MDIHVGVLHFLKLGAKLVQHKIQQYCLTTTEHEIVNTNYGQIKGVKRKTIYDVAYYAFEGIPYAKPPLNELRFRAPQPPEPWEGIRDCTNCKNKPMQKHFVLKIIEGSEDCLYLNVYAKQLKSEQPLPVLVWIYGGGFQIGEASRDLYAPDYFMNEQVVLVEFNYRVGALGFLSLKDPELNVPGNAGLKDQIMALSWIKQNIANFNGDANNITIFGESAGAAATQFMMLSEKSKGLFHKVIMQSGSVLCPWAQTPERNWAYRVACELGYRGAKIDKEILQFLSKVDARKFPKADANLLTKEEKCEQLLMANGPTVEPYITEQCIVPKPYLEMLKTAWGNDLPLLIGGTSFEGLFAYQRATREPYVVDDLGDCEILVPDEVLLDCSAAELKAKGLILKREFFGLKEPSVNETLFPYLDLTSYRLIWHGVYRTVLARRAYAAQTPTYLYRFDFDSRYFNHYRLLTCGKSMRGVSHADDLSYLFYNIASHKLPKHSAEYKTIERMIKLWTSFAATSDPNCDLIKPIVWQPVNTDDNVMATLKCLNINEEIKFIDLPEQTKLKVMDSLYKEGTLY